MMTDDQVPTPAVPLISDSDLLPTQTRRAWWRPRRQTWIILLVALGSIFGGRDTSGDAPGQGLAGAFEALFFVLGAGLIGAVALIRWLSHYFRVRNIVLTILGFLALLVVASIW
jgi:hypothetical protein